MLKKVIKYTNYFGQEKEKTLYFNLTKSEITMMGLSTEGGLDNVLTNLLETDDQPKIMEYFEKILLMSYGEKSEDGERFMKSPEISRAFKETPAYDMIFMELITDEEQAAAFINEVMPKDLDEYVDKIVQKRSNTVPINGAPSIQ